MEFVCDTGKRFSGNPRSMFDSSQTPYQEILHPTNPSATGAIPVQVSTGRLVARGGERDWEHNTDADVCRKAVNHEFLSRAEIPQNSLVLHSKDCKYRSSSSIDSPHLQRFQFGR